MAKQKKEKVVDVSAEQKIIRAARKVFTRKGYAATRTRDIADEAGINLALLNYYYRSKEKLFQLVMAEKLQQLFSVVFPIVNDDQLTLDQKVKSLVERYIDMLLENPELPMFVFYEIKSNPEHFKDRLQVTKLLKESSLVRQLQEKNPKLEPVQFIASLLGMTIFPFVAKPILFSDDRKFRAMMEERKAFIVKWSKAMLKS